MSRFGSRLLMIVCCAGTFLSGAAALPLFAAEAPRPIRFRLEWSGGDARLWSGIVESSAGRLENPASLGLEADVPGSIGINRELLWFSRRSVGVFDGVDATIVGDPNTPVSVTLQAVDPTAKTTAEPARWRFEFRPADLKAEPRVLTLANSETRISLRRAPGDPLAVSFDRPHLIFDPGERFAFDVALNVIPQREQAEGTFTWKFCPARSETVLDSGSQGVSIPRTGNGLVVPLEISLPREEGVYDIHLALSGRALRAESETLQLVVLSREPIAAYDTGRPDRVVDSFEPARPGVFRRLEKQRPLRGMNEPLGRLFGFLPRSASETTGVAEQHVEWNAFKLHLKNPERPHRLVVTLPAGEAQNVGISLLEPNAAAQLMPIGLDSGLTVSEESIPLAGGAGSSSDMPPIAHNILFWPKVREPILLLHDMGTGRPMNVAKVETIELGSLARATPSAMLSPMAARRLVGPYLHKPLFPENFGAIEAYDAGSGRSLDDWQTFYAGAERFIRYLHHESCNSALLAVLSDGSAIYPSVHLNSTPRYDTGALFSTGQDPLRKDVLELLYRLFDREGLALVPQLQFSAPLPALERELAQTPAAEQGIELIGKDGRSWRTTRGTVRGLAPYYNPLDARVQEAMLDVVRELVDRYRSHVAFRGVAVELTSNGYMQFPGLDWGYDDDTVARFERDTGVQIPKVEGQKRFAARYEFLTGQERARWVQWRCRELARFHQQMAEIVTSVGDQSRFVLSATNVLRGLPWEEEIESSIKSRGNFADLLPPRGLDFKLHADKPRLVVLRPIQPAATDHPSEDVIDHQANHSSALDAAFASTEPGVLVYRPPQEFRVADFDAVSPWEPALTWLATHAAAAGAEHREPLTHALAARDAQLLFDGGWMVPLGQEDQVRDVRAILLALPAIPFHLDETQQQPVVVRLAKSEGKTWCYIVNECVDPVNVQLRWSSVPGTRSWILPRGTEYRLEKDERGGSHVVVALPAFGLWAFAIEDEQARLQEVAVKIPETVLVQMKQRVQRLGERIAEAQKSAQKFGPREGTLLPNPGFETSPDQRDLLPGWELPVENAAAWALDDSNPRSGKSSLMLVADSDDGATLSSRLPLQDDRIIDIYVWLRSDVDQTDVRVVFEATLGKDVFRQNSDFRVDTRWRRYQFQVTGIPLKAWDDARVRVEMLGPGRIWIDDVDIHSQRLSEEDVRQLTRVYSAVTLAWDEKRYTDCVRLLDSYWSRILADAPATVPPAEESSRAPLRGASRLRSLFNR